MLFEFHISKTAREKYDFDENLFATDGNIIFADFAAASAYRLERDAMPDSRCRKFKAVRSAISNEIVGPSARKMTEPLVT